MTLDESLKGLSLRVAGLAALLIILALGAASHLQLRTFERQLLPELTRKAVTVGRALSDTVSRALSAGIPLRSLVGVESYLADVRSDHAEISYIGIADADGTVIFHVGTPPPSRPLTLADVRAPGEPPVTVGTLLVTLAPLMRDGSPVGVVQIGVDRAFIQARQAEILYDILTTLVVCLVVAIEVLFIVVALSVGDPIRLAGRRLAGLARATGVRRYGRDEIGRFLDTLSGLAPRRSGTDTTGGQPLPAEEEIGSHSRIHLPLLVFFFAHELCRSFLPLFADAVTAPVLGLSPDLATALPFALYTVAVVASTPVAGSLADRFGSRAIFLAGLIPAAVGFVGSAFATGLIEFVVYRCLNGVGYAVVTIAALGHIAHVTDGANRAQGMAVFFGASMVACIMGSAIGGILADRLGFGPTFLISAALAGGAALLVLRLLPGRRHQAAAASDRRPPSRLRVLPHLFANPRFRAPVLLSAVPTQIASTGLLVFLAPLYMHALGASTAAIGRSLMVYFMVIILVQPLATRIADRHGLHHLSVALGGVVAGAGLIAVPLWPNLWTMVLALAIMGVGHALIHAMQLATLLRHTAGECRRFGQTTVVSLFRLLERTGGIAGPVIAAWLVSDHGHAGAIGLLGTGIAILGLLFVLAGLGWRRSTSDAEVAP